jgi:nucleoid DNA-binding protein
MVSQDAWERSVVSGQEMTMAERIETKAFVHQLALRMQTDDNVAVAWLEATLETLYENFKAGKGVALTGFGGFYVQPRGKTWAFKFNPGQNCGRYLGGHRRTKVRCSPSISQRIIEKRVAVYVNGASGG